MESFYAERGGHRSRERDFGVWWTIEIDSRGAAVTWPRYRISVVHDTGDVYAMRLSATSDDDGTVELLGNVGGGCSGRHDSLCPYKRADGMLSGWAEMIYKPGSFSWARIRLAPATP